MKHQVRRTRSSEAGFTLIEALMAIVILVFGLVAVTNLLIVAANSNASANQMGAAASIAAARMEQLKATPFNALVAGGDVDADVANYNADTTVPGAAQIHTRWSIQPLQPAAGAMNQAYYIRVRARPAGVLLASRSQVEFRTYRSCTDPAQGCPAAP